jgi:hypothetical protein
VKYSLSLARCSSILVPSTYRRATIPKMQLAMTWGPIFSCLLQRAVHMRWALQPGGTWERCACSTLIQMYPLACWSPASSNSWSFSTYGHSFFAISRPIMFSRHSKKLSSLSLEPTRSAVMEEVGSVMMEREERRRGEAVEGREGRERGQRRRKRVEEDSEQRRRGGVSVYTRHITC